MKKLIFTLLISLFALNTVAQHNIEVPRYKLYPTENMWIFLKLDSQTGKIWMVQYAINDDENRFETILNDEILTWDNNTSTSGRFSLIPTQNMYNFILIDHISGYPYQVQWHTDPNKRMVIPIPLAN